MRTRLTELLKSYQEYNSFDEFTNVLTLDGCTDFDKNSGITLDELEDVGVVEFVTETLGYHGLITFSSPKKIEPILSFDEFVKENELPKTQSYMGRLDDCTIDEDDENLDEEE